MVSAQPQCTLGTLAGANALLGGLDAMADGIAHHVGERLGDRIQNTFVEIGLAAPDHKLDFFPALTPDVPHNPRKPAEQLFHRHHANLHDRMLQVIQNPPLKRHGVGKLSAQYIFRKALCKFEQRLLQHRFRQDQFADQIEYAVDSFRVHSQQGVGAARYRGCCRRCFPSRRRVVGNGVCGGALSGVGSRGRCHLVLNFRISALRIGGGSRWYRA